MKNLINAQNVKALAKDFGSEIYEKDLQVSAAFIEQTADLFAAIIKYQVCKQESLAGTLRETDWANLQIDAAENLIIQQKEEA
tara:strand:+ start:1677 stop:1925 length:249 start_codon:yes stop_codon:yes gene_type:complete